MSVRTSISVVLIALLLPVTAAFAAPPFVAPELTVEIEGIELAPQSVLGFALFVFEVRGECNGKDCDGWGWIAATHDALPVEMEGDTAMITGGFGEIHVGPRRYDVEVVEGELELFDLNEEDVFDDDYLVTLSVDICNFFGTCQEHSFLGVLSHQTFIPSIAGMLIPVGP